MSVRVERLLIQRMALIQPISVVEALIGEADARGGEQKGQCQRCPSKKLMRPTSGVC